jgi:hypothetical protein
MSKISKLGTWEMLQWRFDGNKTLVWTTEMIAK